MRFLTGLLVGLALAVLLAALVAGALSSGFSAAFGTKSGCDAPLPEGIALEPEIDDTGAIVRAGGATRTVTYTFGAADLDGGVAALCGSVGDIVVVPSDGTDLRLVLEIRHEGARAERAVEETEVGAAFAREGSRIGLSSWRVNTIEAWAFPFSFRPTHVTTTLHVPDELAFAYDARTDVGKVSMGAVDATSILLRADVGDVVIDQARARGDVDVATDVGDVEVALADAEGVSVAARADVGAVTLRLPEGVAYDLRAQSDVGKVTLALGGADVLEREDSGPGESVHVRSDGWTGAATGVSATATTDVGDVTLTRG